MPLENVARIEVIRGPGSALYVADAFAGVINFLTKTATQIDGLRLGLRRGSFDGTDAWVQYGGRVGGFDLAAAVQGGRTAGPHRSRCADWPWCGRRRWTGPPSCSTDRPSARHPSARSTSSTTRGDARPPVADCTAVDLGLRLAPGGPWDLAFTVSNLFDADAREPSFAPGSIPFDFPMPRRNYRLQLGDRV